MGFVASGLKSLGSDLTTTNPYQAINPNNDPRSQQQYQQLVNAQGGQTDLASALKAQAAGNGPNPAQAQFQQNTNQIAGQQAGSIASQKGISPALAAQLISQQYGAAQQNASGQAATLQAQQQLAAQQQLEGVYAQQAASANGSQQTNNQGIMGAQNINAGVAGQNTASQNQMTQGVMQGVSSAMAQGAKMMSGAGGAAAAAAHGGEMPSMGDVLKAGGDVPGQAKMPGDHPQNDTIHAMLSPGEIVIPRSLVDDPDRAKKFIEQIRAKKKGYGAVIEKRRVMQRTA